MDYKILSQQQFSIDEFSIVPIRFEDRASIMKWRNDQLYHLRQEKPLTAEDQDHYFENTVSKLFDEERPNQILFSYLKGNQCIGYGGLVHINWIDRNAEISFIMATELEQDQFGLHWTNYLRLIEQVAFSDLPLNKIFTYAFDLRPHLYKALEDAGFQQEAVLKDHCFFNNKFKDVVIHSKFKDNFKLARATDKELDVTFKWASDETVRKYSTSQDVIEYEGHTKWFLNKINDPNVYYYIAFSNNVAVGSIRFDIVENEAVISFLVDSSSHGKGYGRKISVEGIERFKKDSPHMPLTGIIQNHNEASLKIYRALGFDLQPLNENITKVRL